MLIDVSPYLPMAPNPRHCAMDNFGGGEFYLKIILNFNVVTVGIFIQRYNSGLTVNNNSPPSSS